jgi:uncharacterized membrane protein YhaH (DUF805 family)
MSMVPEDVAPAERPDWFSTIGRRGRLSFLLNFLFVNLGVGVISAIAAGMGGVVPSLVGAGCSVVGGWVNICLTAQRLHDLGRSGWLQAIPFGASILGVALLAQGEPLATALGSALLLAGCLGFLLWLLLARGMAEGNEFGPVPAAPTQGGASHGSR